LFNQLSLLELFLVVPDHPQNLWGELLLQVGRSSCGSTNSVKALKDNTNYSFVTGYLFHKSTQQENQNIQQQLLALAVNKCTALTIMNAGA